jgi:hypothetical protein
MLSIQDFFVDTLAPNLFSTSLARNFAVFGILHSSKRYDSLFGPESSLSALRLSPANILQYDARAPHPTHQHYHVSQVDSICRYFHSAT